METKEKWMAVGKILRDWGVRGQVKALLFNPDSSIFTQHQKFYYLDGSEYLSLDLEEARPHGKFWVLKFKGYPNPEATLELRSKDLYLTRGELPELSPDEVYIADLKGLRVFGPSGEDLGCVQQVMQVGESEVLIIGENARDTVMIPYETDFIAKTSRPEGEIHLKPLAQELIPSSDKENS